MRRECDDSPRKIEKEGDFCQALVRRLWQSYSFLVNRSFLLSCRATVHFYTYVQARNLIPFCILLFVFFFSFSLLIHVLPLRRSLRPRGIDSDGKNNATLHIYIFTSLPTYTLTSFCLVCFICPPIKEADIAHFFESNNVLNKKKSFFFIKTKQANVILDCILWSNYGNFGTFRRKKQQREIV